MTMTTGFDLDAILALARAQLWQVTLAALALGAAARLAGRRRPRVGYTLWMLVLLKALVPPVVSSPTGVFSWAMAGPATNEAADRPVAAPPVLLRGLEEVGPVLPGGEEPRPIGPADSAPSRLRGRVPILAGLIWLTGLSAGVLFLAAACIVGARRIGRTSREANPDLADRLASLARRLGVTRPVRLLVTGSPLGPAAFGVLRPTVLLPAPLLRGLGPDQLDLVLAHELVHIRRGDVLAGHLQLLARLLWWFHPLAWWAGREASRLRELCCDEEVVSALACAPARYARGLLEVLDRKRQLRPLFSVPGMRPIDITSQRLEHIMRYRDDHRRRTSLVCRLVFALGAILIIPGAALVQEGSKPPAKEREEPAAGKDATRGAVEAKSAAKPSDESDDDRLELQIAEERLKWAEDMHRKGYASDGQVAGERSKLESIKIRQAEGRVKRTEEMYRKGNVSASQVDRERDALRRLEISRAAIDLARAKDRLDWAEKMFAKGYVSQAQVSSERFNYRRANSQVEALAATAATVTLRGVVRDKATGRPLAGIQVSGGGEGTTESLTAKTDADGRFELRGLPAHERYAIVVACVSGEPYLLSSRVVEVKKGEPSPSADVDLVRGIPFRIRILEAATGKPIRGGISYFPLYPNNPVARGVLGYTATGEWVGGAFYEASLGPEGDYRGAVLPGKGVLCFQPTGGKWEWKKGERDIAFFSPDGLDVVKVEGTNGPGPFVHGVPLSRTDPPAWGGLGLIHYPAVIAINPPEGTREIDYEFKIRNPEPTGR
jgi:beta-lactamase regulating signal transducer with metallopeptidase domain